MIFEHRTYTLHPGKLQEYWQHYRDDGVRLMTNMLPQLVGYFVSEIGELNQVVILFHFKDLQDRMDKHGQMNADPEWQAFLGRVRPLIARQESKILFAAPVPELAPILPMIQPSC